MVLQGPTNVTARESEIIDAQPVDFAGLARDMTIGTVNAVGPADMRRRIEYDPSTGKFTVEVETKNSDWLGGAFRGLWSSASAMGDWLATAAAGAAP